MSQELLKLIHEKYKDRVICVASPLPEKVDYRFNLSNIEFITQTMGIFSLRLHHAVSSRIAVNRNNAVIAARQMGCTDILWIDGDTKFPVNGMLKLLQHNKDIVGATTCQRNNKGLPIGTPLDIGKQESTVRMKLLGFPFILTKMSVFDKMDELWPERKNTYFAEPPRWAFPQIEVVRDTVVGEDEYFCHYAIEAGFDIWCDMELSMEIGHIGSEVFYISSDNIIDISGKAEKIDESI